MAQTVDILKYLIEGNSITPLEALQKFGCFRLGARIWDLKKLGFLIDSKLVTTQSGKHIAQYKLKISRELNKKINMVAEKPEPRLIMVICSDTTCKFNVKGCTKLPTITIKDMGTAPVCASYE